MGHLQELIPRDVRTIVISTCPFAVARLEVNPERLPSVFRSPLGNSCFLEMVPGLSIGEMRDSLIDNWS